MPTELFGKLKQLEFQLERVRQEKEDMQRVLSVYGEKAITNASLERLDSGLLELSRIRDEIRELFAN